MWVSTTRARTRPGLRAFPWSGRLCTSDGLQWTRPEPVCGRQRAGMVPERPARKQTGMGCSLRAMDGATAVTLERPATCRDRIPEFAALYRAAGNPSAGRLTGRHGEENVPGRGAAETGMSVRLHLSWAGLPCFNRRAAKQRVRPRRQQGRSTAGSPQPVSAFCLDPGSPERAGPRIASLVLPAGLRGN